MNDDYEIPAEFDASLQRRGFRQSTRNPLEFTHRDDKSDEIDYSVILSQTHWQKPEWQEWRRQILEYTGAIIACGFTCAALESELKNCGL
ncbi:MAG: hypothetical protein KGO48_16155 [Alphaproteobacteria bacterium]|nr:hypothetical protein [Alphaproteobacteria bacterium]